MPTDLDVLLFDFGGTLDACGVAWKDRFARLFAEAGVVSADFDRAFYSADDALVGAISPDLPFDDTVELLARGVAVNLGLDGSGVARRVADRFVADSRACLAASAGVLTGLHRRYRIGLVSNFYGNLSRVCADVGLADHLDVVVDSSAAGVSKPDPAIFRIALDALAAQPEAALFVGDSMPRDMAGARALGMPHVLVAAGEVRGCCPGDRVIASVGELPGALS